MTSINFDDIRPYYDSEVPEAIEQLCVEPQFVGLAGMLFPNVPSEALVAKLKQMKTATQFQMEFMRPVLRAIIHSKSSGLTVSGLEHVAKQSALILSNHRDIILDSAFLNLLMLENNLESTEIAIGDNLLIYPWIRSIVRINKSFIVKRNLPVRESIGAFNQLSAYVRHTINETKHSIWIAQREGRAKNSDDRTQASLLKMFALSGEGTFAERLRDLHLCPLSISYEYDPCDYLKAKEFQQKRDDANYKKSPQDDLINMRVGLEGNKGAIHYAFTPIMDGAIDKLAEKYPAKNDLVEAIAAGVDSQIHSNYKIYTINRVAYDLFLNTNKFATTYSADELSQVNSYIETQLDKIDLPNVDRAFCRERILEMYAMPLINQLKTVSIDD